MPKYEGNVMPKYDKNKKEKKCQNMIKMSSQSNTKI